MSSAKALEPSPFLGKRLISLDQFRGYTVAGMFLVNFLGKFNECPEVLKHHNTYNSYADTIMPGFFLAVGFAFRLTFGRRAESMGVGAAYARVIRRFLGLGLFAIIYYASDGHEVRHTWAALRELGFWDAVKDPLKRDWFQTLLHIAVTCLWLTPVIRSGALVRTLYMIGSAALHVFLSYKFNFLWCNNGGNAIDGGPLGFLTWTIPAIVGTLACDAVANTAGRAPLVKLTLGGIFLMLLGYAFSCGTRMYDLSPSEVTAQKQVIAKYHADRKVVSDEAEKVENEIKATNKKVDEIKAEIDKRKRAVLAAKLAEANVQTTGKLDWLVMREENKITNNLEAEYQANGWPDPQIDELEKQIEQVKVDQKFEENKQHLKEVQNRLKYDFPDPKLATDPVWPSQERIEKFKARYAEEKWLAVLAEPPFVPPPADDPRVAEPPPIEHRLWNYWMMSQRAGTISYLTFAAGFNLLAYVLFYILGDMAGVSIGVFRTFGMNALAGYVAHGWVGSIVKQFMPEDVPAWYMWAGFSLFFYVTWLFLRTLEKQKIYLRL